MHSISVSPLLNVSSHHDIITCLETNSNRYPLAFDTLINLIGAFNYNSVKDADFEVRTLCGLLADSLVPLLHQELSFNPNPSFQNETQFSTDFMQSIFSRLNLSHFQKELYVKTLHEIYNFCESQLISPADKSFFRNFIHCNISKLAFVLSQEMRKKHQLQVKLESPCLCVRLLLVLESPSLSTDIDLKGKINQLHFSLLELKRILLWKISMYQWLLELPNPFESPSINDVLEYHRDLQKLMRKPSSSDSPNRSYSSQRNNLLPAITRLSVSAPSNSTSTSFYDSGISMLESILDNISEKPIKQMDSKLFSSNALK